MFSFSKNKKAVAKITGGKRDGQLIYLVDEEQQPNDLQCDQCGKIFTRKATLKQHIQSAACKGRQIYDIKGAGESFDHFNIDDGGSFQVLPGFSGERDVLYCAAPSGSGKSHWVAQYLKEKNKPIYLFSGIQDDKCFDGIKNFRQIIFDDNFVSKPIDIEELANSTVIFDDIGKLKQPYKDICKQLQDELLEKGRHFKIDVLSTNHLSTNGAETRNLINESNHLVVFPKASSMMETERILTKYVGFPKILIPKLQALGGRSVYIHKNYPQFIMSDKKISKPDHKYF